MLQERGRQHFRRHLFEDRYKIAQIDRGEVLEPRHFLQNDLQRGALRASDDLRQRAAQRTTTQNTQAVLSSGMPTARCTRAVG